MPWTARDIARSHQRQQDFQQQVNHFHRSMTSFSGKQMNDAINRNRGQAGRVAARKLAAEQQAAVQPAISLVIRSSDSDPAGSTIVLPLGFDGVL
ncbi:hypothetical protein ACWKSP_15390, partial [Micromonosporaceae bacterium Da 78-11]